MQILRTVGILAGKWEVGYSVWTECTLQHPSDG